MFGTGFYQLPSKPKNEYRNIIIRFSIVKRNSKSIFCYFLRFNLIVDLGPWSVLLLKVSSSILPGVNLGGLV